MRVVQRRQWSLPGRVAATASSWFAWKRTSASAVRPPARRGGTRPRAGAPPGPRRRGRRPVPRRAAARGGRGRAAALGRGQEERAAVELSRPSRVVEERGRERGDRAAAAGAARPPRGRAWRPRRCARGGRRRRSGARPGGGERSHALAEVCVADERAHNRAQAGVRELLGEEVEEPVQLLEVAPRLRDEPGRVDLRPASSERMSSWSRSRNRSTRPSTRTASPSWKRRSRSSTSLQTRASIRPARIHELDREVGPAPPSCSGAACARRRRRLRRPDPRRAPRWWRQRRRNVRRRSLLERDAHHSECTERDGRRSLR